MTTFSARDFAELMASPHYNEFYSLALELLASGEKNLPYYKFFRNQYIEIAIWPLLYVKPEWCESAIEGGGTRRSAKRAFHLKAMSSIVDFGQDYGLIQYQYDMWMFKTVSGAVESGRTYGTSPMRALETKCFSTAYWQWQHRFLKGAVPQFGYPTLFITISP